MLKVLVKGFYALRVFSQTFRGLAKLTYIRHSGDAPSKILSNVEHFSSAARRKIIHDTFEK